MKRIDSHFDEETLRALEILSKKLASLQGASLTKEEVAFINQMRTGRDKRALIERITIENYIGSNKLKSIIIAIFLLVITGILHISFSLYMDYTEPIIFYILGGGILLLLADYGILKYRIMERFYGTNEYESRKIIHFILENGKKGKFTGGIPKKVFSEDEAFDGMAHDVDDIAPGLEYE